MSSCMKLFSPRELTDLTDQISNNIINILLSGNSYTNKRTVALRIVRYVIENVVNMEMGEIYELKNLIYINYCALKHVEFIWKQYMAKGLNSHETQLMEKILSKDYHKQGDILKLANLFDRKVVDLEGRRHLNKLFAVDGFNGKGYKNYVSHFGNNNKYCGSVRRLYEETSLNSDQIHNVIAKILENRDNNDDDDGEMDEEHSEYVEIFRRFMGTDVEFENVLTARRKEIEARQKEIEKINEVNKNNRTSIIINNYTKKRKMNGDGE